MYIETIRDIWSTYIPDRYLWRCIPTNGCLKRNKQAVCGKGLAKDAADRFPQFPVLLGESIRNQGNKLAIFSEIKLIAFPTKYHWKDKADIELIKTSMQQLVEFANKLPIEDLILLPRPGCGLGGLEWPEVKRIIYPYLNVNQNIVIVSK